MFKKLAFAVLVLTCVSQCVHSNHLESEQTDTVIEQIMALWTPESARRVIREKLQNIVSTSDVSDEVKDACEQRAEEAADRVLHKCSKIAENCKQEGLKYLAKTSKRADAIVGITDDVRAIVLDAQKACKINKMSLVCNNKIRQAQVKLSKIGRYTANFMKGAHRESVIVSKTMQKCNVEIQEVMIPAAQVILEKLGKCLHKGNN